MVIVLVQAWVSYLRPAIRLETLLLCQEEICLEAIHTIVLINNHSFNLSSMGPKSQELMCMEGDLIRMISHRIGM